MKVFLTGGTGFIGSYVLDKLLEEGHEVRLLVRRGSEKKLSKKQRKECDVIKGDITSRRVVLTATEGMDAVINLTGIIREFPQKGVTFDSIHVGGAFNCVVSAQENEVERFLQMSALGTGKEAETEYHKTKYQAELLVKESGIPYTIFRPSIVFGKEDKSINMMREVVRNHKIFPLIGGGKQEWQPVSVEDVAEGIVESLDGKNAENETIEMGGPDVYEFREIVDLLAEAEGKNVTKVPVPSFLAKTPAYFLQYQKWFPASVDMIEMMTKDNVVEGENFNGLDVELSPLKEHLENL